MSARDRLEFTSFDGAITVRTGQGAECVLVQLVSSGASRFNIGGVVLSADEAEALGRGLIRRARFSRASELKCQEVTP